VRTGRPGETLAELKGEFALAVVPTNRFPEIAGFPKFRLLAFIQATATRSLTA